MKPARYKSHENAPARPVGPRVPYAGLVPRTPKPKPEPEPEPSQEPEREYTIEDLLVSMSKQTFPEGAMCTSWVIVSEWMDADGEYWTFVGSDDRSPPWRHTGLLSWALDGSDTLTAADEEDE